jgi:hypothetical protein
MITDTTNIEERIAHTYERCLRRRVPMARRLKNLFGAASWSFGNYLRHIDKCLERLDKYWYEERHIGKASEDVLFSSSYWLYRGQLNGLKVDRLVA